MGLRIVTVKVLNSDDSIFKMLFSDKTELLKLYNALAGTRHQNPEDLTINTLKNAVYMSLRNDVSFLIDLRLNLFEHQSTYNPNLPLRFLFYVSDLLSLITKDDNLYGEKRISLPTPGFLVFYNGQDPCPEQETLKLSASFQVSEDPPRLELIVRVLNINPGHNQKLLAACRPLADYAIYTARVQKYARFMELRSAVERAVNECISENILKDFLEKNRAEAIHVSIYEYDMERHMRQEREDSFAKGLSQGEAIALSKGEAIGLSKGEARGLEKTSCLIRLLLADGRLHDLQKASEDPEYLKKLCEELNIA